jgi:methanogenic corrinoid protein MtbC1
MDNSSDGSNPEGDLKRDVGVGNGPQTIRDEKPGTSADEDEVVITLSRTIENEIIPRLLSAHGAGPSARQQSASQPPAWFTALEIDRFTQSTFAFSSGECCAYVDAVRARDVPLESIILDLLGPAAQVLGTMWKEDRCTFTEVTVGLSRLHQLLRELGQDFEQEKPAALQKPKALLVPAPGEQHTFGLFIVEAFLRREGWDVWSESMDREGALRLVQDHWFSVAGFSLHSERHFSGLPAAIETLRKRSMNPNMNVLVGGQVFLNNPALVISAGADDMAADAREAVEKTRQFLARQHLLAS